MCIYVLFSVLYSHWNIMQISNKIFNGSPLVITKFVITHVFHACATRLSELKMSSDRYYLRYSYLPFGEDRTHEFKGHRDLACEEVPKRQLHSRRSVSRFGSREDRYSMYTSCTNSNSIRILYISAETLTVFSILVREVGYTSEYWTMEWSLDCIYPRNRSIKSY